MGKRKIQRTSSVGNSQELIDAVEALTRRVDRGNIRAARDILINCIVGLQEVVAGNRPDVERLACLKFLLKALKQMGTGVPPSKALGLWTNNRPQTVPALRDERLFIAVGIALDKLSKQGHRASVQAAIEAVAKRTNTRRTNREKRVEGARRSRRMDARSRRHCERVIE
jgi:hypothetical protein